MTDHGQEADSHANPITPEPSRLMRLGANPGDLIDRLEKLRALLPAFAQETAVARREAARLRWQNAKLRRRVAELETRFDMTRDPGSRDNSAS